jgi:hypothetical protein
MSCRPHEPYAIEGLTLKPLVQNVTLKSNYRDTAADVLHRDVVEEIETPRAGTNSPKQSFEWHLCHADLTANKNALHRVTCGFACVPHARRLSPDQTACPATNRDNGP